MRGGIILLVVGLFLGYLAVSGKYCCLGQAVDCATSDSDKPCECKGGKDVAAVKAVPTVQQSLADLLKPLDTGSFTFPYTV